MPVVILYHNERTFSNSGQCKIYGPFPDHKTGVTHLRSLARDINQAFGATDVWQVDAKTGYMGATPEALETADKSADLATEVWAEIVPLTAL